MVTLNELARSVAEKTGCTETDAENFLRELFALSSAKLEADGSVEIPRVGRFAVMDGTVVYQPVEEIADHLNAPFSDFEPIEVPEGYALDGEEPEPEPDPVEKEPAPAEEPILPEPEPVVEEPEPEPVKEPEPVAEEPESQPVVERKSGKSWLWIAACVLCFGAGYLLGGHTRPEPVAEPEGIIADTISVAVPDTVPAEEEIVAPEPVREAVCDTITATRYLTTMARAHYGQMEYWVYIYEANADRLGHPDRLDAGTTVVIPPADSLGLKAGDSQKISEASRKAAEIYARFNR